MKNLTFIYILAFVLMACGDPEDNFIEGDFSYSNPAYPFNADTLKILAIGNSFSVDPISAMGQLIDSAKIDKKRVCLYDAFIAGATFRNWSSQFENNSTIKLSHDFGDISMVSEGPISKLVAQNWDVIVIQQASNYSYDWASYSYLKKLIPQIITLCPNKKLCLVFQLVWSHTPNEMPDVLDGNIECCKKMVSEYGVDVIIPTGTAIQLARGTSLNDANYMTRDNWHLNYGIANYIAACTWYEKLLEPVFHKSILGNTAKPKGSYTNQEILLGQKCALQAIKDPYNYKVVEKLFE